MLKFSPISIALRIAAGLLLVGAAVYAGFAARSPWIILALAVVFTVCHAAGRWRGWQKAVTEHGTATILKGVLSTFVAQCILVGLLYLIGYGLGALINGDRVAAPFSMTDIKGVALLGTVSIGIAALLTLVEPSPAARDGGLENATSVLPNGDSSDVPDLDIDPTPLTVETFYEAPYHGHKDHEAGGLKPEALLTDEQIAAQEQRLGIVLPPLLKQLYRRQNGGNVGWLLVPLKADPSPTHDDWRGAFSIDYCDLMPLTNLSTLFEAQCAWLDPDSPEDADQFVPGAKQIIPLSMRYMDCTVLDYSNPGAPRAGIVDYDSDGTTDIWFDTFEDLFAALRRERDN